MPMRRIQLSIRGMHCGGCAQRVETALRGAPGVSEASVNLMSESASVACDAGSSAAEGLIAAVRAAGFDAAPLESAAELAARIGGDETDRRAQRRRERRALLLALGLALPIVALDYAGPRWGSDPPQAAFWNHAVQLALLVLLAASPSARVLFSGAVQALRHRAANMDVLISMGVTVATVSSVYGAFVAHRHEFVHLHAAAMILALVGLGRYLEAGAKGRASAAMTVLARRAPRTALVQRDGRLVTLPVEQLLVGDVISIPTHAAIPVDGAVLDGTAAVDESLMTGEPLPETRRAGDTVLGGTIVTDGVLTIRATAVGGQSALGRIIQLVAQAQTGRTAMQRLADRVASVFTPVVLVIATATFAAWLAIGGRPALAQATQAAVAVLVVACPCALGLATPTVVMVASGLAAQRGILVRDAAMLEAMGSVGVVVWDKTGTLTSGSPTVRRLLVMEHGQEMEVLRLAAAAEQFSQHPIAKALVVHALRQDIDLPAPADFESTPGGGVAATVDGRRVVVGSLRFAQSLSESDNDALTRIAEAARAEGDTVVGVAVAGRPAGVFLVADSIRPAAAAAVSRLRELGVRSEMLTGDEAAVGRAVAAQVGIDGVWAGVSPAVKVARIEELRRGGERVAMIGDGVNDAAALAAADVGIAFATGADVAAEAAGVNLIGSSPQLAADAVALARASLRVIRQNLFWAFFYNVLMIPLAAVGALPPAVAAGAMMVSSLTVVLNALRLPHVLRRPDARHRHVQP